MNGRQINFYLTPDDVLELFNYMTTTGIVVCGQPMFDENVREIESFSQLYEQSVWLKKHFVLRADTNKLDLIYSEAQNYYAINETKSPAIEFWQPYFNAEEKIMRRGRLYYTKQYYNAAGELVQKDPEFLATADKLFKWIRKTFKDAKLPGYEGLLVSPRAAAWARETGGELLVNN